MAEAYMEKASILASPSAADPENRDPNHLNKHLQLDFTNVIAEPDESSYSFPFVHRVAGQVYHYSKVFVYRLLTIVIGLPLMLFWGLLFGVYTFGMIWFVAPMRRLMQSCISEVGIYIQAISDAIIAPISRSYGNIFSRIQIKLSTEQIHAIKQLQV